MAAAKKVFIAATRQNDGKTSVSVGLFRALQKRFGRLAYIKPVGQQYKVIDGEKIDKDAVLFKQVYQLDDPLPLMSPIAVPSGFTESYILSPHRDALEKKVKDAFQQLSTDKDLVVVEGTGHGGVGSVFDMSNADVAKCLDTPIVLVSLGGIGKSIDEILLNKAFFESKGCRIAGVVINKVQADKLEKLTPLLTTSLQRNGLKLLGMIPFTNMLTRPTIRELAEDLEAEVVCGDAVALSNRVETFVIGAMLPHDAMRYFTPNTLLIVPANREDLMMTALCGKLLGSEVGYSVSGVILTGGLRPHESIVSLFEKSGIPMILVKEDSFKVATDINKMLFKLKADETEKIQTIQNLVESHVNIDAICEALS
jgi:phosphate acetyltransferase